LHHFTLALFQSINALITTVTIPVVGYLCDRLGHRWLFIAISELLAALYIYLIYVSVILREPLIFLLAAAISGLSTSFWNSSLTPYIDEIRGNFSTSQVLGFLGIISRLMTIPTVGVAGYILEKSLTAYFTIAVTGFVIVSIVHLVTLPRCRVR